MTGLIDFGYIATGLAGFVVGLIVKTMLDLRLAVHLVKYLSYVPSRWIFRHKPLSLAGTWEHIWESGGSVAYKGVEDRHAHPEMRQFGSYCYAEFYSQKKIYYFFGRISGEHLVGDWADRDDPAGYFGAFQLRIIDSRHLSGVWIGHSKTSIEIRHDMSVWKKLS